MTHLQHIALAGLVLVVAGLSAALPSRGARTTPRPGDGLDTHRSMLARARGAVAVARRRDHVAYASGVLLAPDRVLTCRHVTHVHNGSSLRRSAGTLEVVLSDDGTAPPRRFPVVGYAHTSKAHDLCVLAIGPDADGRWPEADRVQRLAVERAALGDPLYLVHFPRGGPRRITDDASVLFPFQATPGEMERLRARLLEEAEGEGGARDAWVALRGSYRARGDGTFENASRRWAGQPVLGVAGRTLPGSSGAPVFVRRTHGLAGILFAGVHGERPAGATSWEHHEAILPAVAILDDLARGEDAVCRALAEAALGR